MWSLGVWTDWKVARSERCSEDSDKFPAGVGDITQISEEEIDLWLFKFVLVQKFVKLMGNALIKTRCMYGICCGLQRYLRDDGRPKINLWTDYNLKVCSICMVRCKGVEFLFQKRKFRLRENPGNLSRAYISYY